MTTANPLPRRGLFKAGAALSTVVLTPVAAGSAAAATNTSATTGAATAGPTESAGSSAAEAELRALEQRYTARLGVYARNVRTGQVVSHRARERFAMCSTFKTFAAAAILRGEGGSASLEEVVPYPPAELVPNSPVTEQHVSTGMSVGDLCAAAIQRSDNAAGNLLLRRIGGPAGLTRFFRSIGDSVSRLDRWEPELNTAAPGDVRDTTTPQALGTGFEQLTLGRVLADADREQLVTWLKGNTTSAERFRAGLPHDWVVGDKTGTGDYASANDIGVAWTTRGTPLVVTVLTSKPTPDASVDNALIADAARVVARTLAPGE
ncbi:class A beta-lactamase [Streptomyces sp. NPDC015220]|uniref:class A beta-lactamase n=1 Tax=Streptomyces sp. NPDC015220 TaxID=3364947 RepID=UPI0036FAED91